MAPKTIVEWQEQGFPIALRGGPGVPSEYESAGCIDWLVEREVRKVQNERPQDRLARVQADKIEMENAEKRNQLIPADEVEPIMTEAVIAARVGLLDAVQRLARELPADALGREEMLQAEFEAFLHRLADWAHADQYDDEVGA